MAKRTSPRYAGIRIGRRVCLVAAWWLWMPVGAVIIWLISDVLLGGYGHQAQSYVLLLQAELFPHDSLVDPAPLFLIWLFVGLVGTLLLTIDIIAEGRREWPVRIGVIVVVAAMGASGVYAVRGLWDNDLRAVSYYARGTVFCAPGLNPAPSSLRPLTDSARRAPRGSACAYVGTAGVPSCIRIGSMPDFDFAPRTASYEAATTMMSDSAALASQVNLMSPTVHYLPGATPGQGVWTAILDGSGTRPAEGVAVWNGESNMVSICQFEGSDGFNRAFNGTGGDSLRNLIAQRFPSLVYTDRDISGFCRGRGISARPVIVIPVERQITDGHLYFVTPLTPRNSGSQAVVAYAVERADEVGPGLNPLVVYVQSDQANQTSMTVLQSRMTTYINQVAPSLLASGSGGELLEVIPYGPSMWRGFVDIDGVTQDYIDMSSSATVTPALVSLPGRLTGQGPAASAGASGGGAASGCGANPAAMSTSQLAQCIQAFAKALSQRAQSPPATRGR